MRGVAQYLAPRESNLRKQDRRHDNISRVRVARGSDALYIAFRRRPID